MRVKREPGEIGIPLTLPMGLLLAVSAGYMDAYSYLARGGVFANAQTGNILLLAVHLAEGNLSQVLHYACPVAAFGLGIFFAYLLTQLVCYGKPRGGTCLILGLEICGLFGAAWIGNDLLANALISLVCGMQLQAFPLVGGKAAATTMCIGNYRMALQWTMTCVQVRSRSAGKKAAVYAGVILSFALGAVLSARVISVAGGRAIWGSCVLLLLAVLLKTLEPRAGASVSAVSEMKQFT